MKKISLVALLPLALVGGALAQKPAPKAPTKISCAVQKGDMVDIAAATKTKMFTDYKGKRYFFCCQGCPQAFKKEPAKYAKTAPSIPTPKK